MSAVWFDGAVSITPTAIRRTTTATLRRIERQVGEDIHRLRVDAGLPIAAVATATGHDASFLARIEAGTAHPSNAVLISIGVALGADLSLRYFPGTGPRIHDRFQAPMSEALLRGLDQRWQRQLEVLITKPARGVIDIVLSDASSTTTVATEVYSDLRRLEQQIRWSNEKADGLAAKLASRDLPRDVSRLLVLRSTAATRVLAREFETTLATAYPARAADVVAALTTPDRPWPGAGLIWMHLHGTKATLMHRPPPGVALGR